jgi:hypothetical protein
VVLLATGATSALARVGSSTIGNPSIDKIIFGGTPSNPGITITGSDLTYDRYYGSEAPTPNPLFTPGATPAARCRSKARRVTTTGRASSS